MTHVGDLPPTIGPALAAAIVAARRWGASRPILMFVTTLADVDAKGAPLVAAAKADRLAWMAHPKAGQLGTDLNRDILWKHLLRVGIQGVRQVALDDVWSAMRFRPAK